MWDSAAELESIFHLLFRHMNSIASMLAADREHFESLFSER